MKKFIFTLLMVVLFTSSAVFASEINKAVLDEESEVSYEAVYDENGEIDMEATRKQPSIGTGEILNVTPAKLNPRSGTGGWGDTTTASFDLTNHFQIPYDITTLTGFANNSIKVESYGAVRSFLGNTYRISAEWQNKNAGSGTGWETKSSATFKSGTTETKNITGLTGGTTYRLRVYGDVKEI